MKCNVLVLMVMIFLIHVTPTISKITAKREKRFSLFYQQRLYFKDFDNYAVSQDASLPKLNKNARFHGASVQGNLSEKCIFGLYANGTLKRKENSTASTDWGGGIASLYGQYRLHSTMGFFTSAGLGLGCGRVSYTSCYNDGNRSISVFTDAIFLEPMINAGYSYNKFLHIMVEGTYMTILTSNDYYAGNFTLPQAFPNGFFLSVSIGYTFPFLIKT